MDSGFDAAPAFPTIPINRDRFASALASVRGVLSVVCEGDRIYIMLPGDRTLRVQGDMRFTANFEP